MKQHKRRSKDFPKPSRRNKEYGVDLARSGQINKDDVCQDLLSFFDLTIFTKGSNK